MKPTHYTSAIFVVFILFTTVFCDTSYAESENSSAIEATVQNDNHSDISYNKLFEASYFLNLFDYKPKRDISIYDANESFRQTVEYKNVVNPYVPYTFEQMISDANTLQSMYPGLISIDSIGKSVEGRDLLLIKLGKGDNKILFCGSHHAREYISTTFLMKTIDEYALAYQTSGVYGNYNVVELLDKFTVYIVPMVNPDGVNLVINGINSVKDIESVKKIKLIQSSYKAWKANIRGVDLNRQYPVAWNKNATSPKVPASEKYKGSAPATEPEVKAMMELSKKHNFLLSVSFHAKGEIIYWGDSGTVNSIPQAKQIAQRFCNLTGYGMTPISQPQYYSGGYENWFRQEFKRPSFCVELTPYTNGELPHPDSQFDNLVWNKAKYVGLFFMTEAYQLIK